MSRYLCLFCNKSWVELTEHTWIMLFAFSLFFPVHLFIHCSPLFTKKKRLIRENRPCLLVTKMYVEILEKLRHENSAVANFLCEVKLLFVFWCERYVALSLMQRIFVQYFLWMRIYNYSSSSIYFCFVFVKLDGRPHC